jgi:hypothetical protein
VRFLDLLQEHNIETAPDGHHHARDGWVQFDCPHCGRGSRKWHMGYNIAFGYVNCWRCGPHRLTETVTELIDLPFDQVRRLLKDVDREEGRKRERKPRGKLTLPKGVGALHNAHQRYLKRRGFSPARLIKLWGIGGICIAARLQWRIFIPIHYHGEIVSFTTRSLSDETKAKYVNARPEEESINHKELLYGEDYCRGSIICFEGPLDVWQVGPGSVCTFGTNYLTPQMKRLSKYSRVGICFDNEHTAQKRAKELCESLEWLGCDAKNIRVDRRGQMISDSDVLKLRRFLE